jgi:endonuclease/exonuclease/phosphatase family metal-dependent hydrolase
MQRRFFALVLTLLPLAVLSPGLAQSGATLKVMTYNLRFASETPPHAWPDRRPLVARVIRDAGPDVIGTQEGVYSQLKDMADDLDGYDWIGLGRDGGSRGEFMAVFYRSGRLEPVAFDHFWLSDTPAVIGSTTWGNSNRRMVTWVRFREKATGAEFAVWNTHFDHEVQRAREKSAELLRLKLAEQAPGLPVILLGDFNAPAGANPAYTLLTEGGGLEDAWLRARRREGEGEGTFNGFGQNPHGAARIDWILVSPGVEVASAAVVTTRVQEQYPSDHYPVTAELRLPSAAGR